jgi:hypothetical protein
MLKKIMSESEDQNQYYWFFGLYIFTVILNYFTPDFIRIPYYLILLILFYKSVNNAFWIAFFWCLFYAPAYLFNVSDQNYCLPIFGLPGLGRDIMFTEVFVILIMIKSIFAKKVKMKTNAIFWLITAFALFLILVSTTWGFTGSKVFRTIRFLIPYTLFWTLPRLIQTVNQFKTLFNYFLIFIIPVVLCQAFVFITGQHLMFVLGGSFTQENKLKYNEIQFDSAVELIRPLYSTHILLLNIFYCLYLMLEEKSEQLKNSIPSIAIFLTLNFMSFLVTGTRGYILAAVAMIGIYYFVEIQKFVMNIKYFIVGIFAFYILSITPLVGKQISLSLERLFTIQAMLEGDKTAGGTLKRLTVRQPKVMKHVEKSPIIGYGFSNTYYDQADGHVANASIMLNSGIIGFGIFVFFNLRLMYISIELYYKTRKKQILGVIIGLVGFLVVHSTSYMVFSFALGQGNFLAFVLLLAFINVIIEENKNKLKHELS